MMNLSEIKQRVINTRNLTCIIVCLCFAGILFYGCKKEDTNEAPTCTIKNPVDGSTVHQGDTVFIRAEENDPEGAIQKVKIYINNQLAGESDQPPYNFKWPVLEEQSEGNYTIKVEVIDEKGKKDSDEVTIFIAAPETG